jgi:hypothetical protein
MACLAWNLALIKQESEEEYESQLKGFFKKLGGKSQIEVFRPLIEALIYKKMEEYDDINRMIISYDIHFKGKNLTLNVASTISPEELEIEE